MRRKRKKKKRYHRGEYTSTKTGELCKFRSGWEEKFMVYLDGNQDVKSWSYETLAIEYVSNNRTKKSRKYYPDFIVEYCDGRVEVIEIKPKRKLEQAAVIKKAAAAAEWCKTQGATYKILTEIELKNIGLL